MHRRNRKLPTFDHCVHLMHCDDGIPISVVSKVGWYLTLIALEPQRLNVVLVVVV